jgi:hypothetical protein
MTPAMAARMAKGEALAVSIAMAAFMFWRRIHSAATRGTRRAARWRALCRSKNPGGRSWAPPHPCAGVRGGRRRHRRSPCGAIPVGHFDEDIHGGGILDRHTSYEATQGGEGGGCVAQKVRGLGDGRAGNDEAAPQGGELFQYPAVGRGLGEVDGRDERTGIKYYGRRGCGHGGRHDVSGRREERVSIPRQIRARSRQRDGFSGASRRARAFSRRAGRGWVCVSSRCSWLHDCDESSSPDKLHRATHARASQWMGFTFEGRNDGRLRWKVSHGKSARAALTITAVTGFCPEHAFTTGKPLTGSMVVVRGSSADFSAALRAGFFGFASVDILSEAV